MRRVFWGMNYATRLNLKLALPVGRRAEELTDLDCVAFSTGADFSVRLLVADCKSGQRVSPAARAFWLAGARDFFGADRAYLVLQRSVQPNVRELAGRLGLDLLEEADRQILENVHGPHAPTTGHFDVTGASRVEDLLTHLDGRLESLNRFREHEYWHLPSERRLQRLIVELRRVGAALKVEQLSHRVLVLDLLFLFALAVLGACRYVSSVSLHDPRGALLQYLLGGPAMTRERQHQMESLRKAAAKLPDQQDGTLDEVFRLEPPYFDALAETVGRFLRRPRDAQRVLRYLEWWAHGQEALGLPPVPSVLGGAYGEYTQKLVSDLARTCFVGAGLGGEWIEIANRAGAVLEDAEPEADIGQGQAANRAARGSVASSDGVNEPQLPLEGARPEKDAL